MVLGQRLQQGLLDGEVLADGARALADPALVVLLVPCVDPGVELGQGGDFGDGDQVVAAESSDLALDATLLVGAVDAGPAVEDLQANPGAERGPSLGLHAGARVKPRP
ncbi:hypothetical protein QFZ22_009576 [Streptomyces canus]|uniref:Uncharacterized protein n=1 Tax=Streptomyces canus TaxID=58343 RepID=A0AAW8FU97_9ACTN|nr:hypothetical protein [Streptomyces canus]MDQ0913504.1 hypothetical protein [Streptomyces canus]